MILRRKYPVKDLAMMGAMSRISDERSHASLDGCRQPHRESGTRSLGELVAEYIEIHRPRWMRDRKRFLVLRSLDDAVVEAAGSARADGKRENHQRRIPKDALDRFATAVLKQPLANARDFEDLHAYVARAGKPIRGIGELAIYDVALRIGWFGRMEPKRVYLHAGTRAGAKALGLDGSAATLPLDAFPAELRVLDASEIEDFLCIYKSELPRLRRSATGL
jgi:hypothetical protein